MSERSDLTRWNRAGLSRFRYVDGNAVTFLEALRRQLWQRFRDPAGVDHRWETLSQQTIPQEGQENEYRWDLLPRKRTIPERENDGDRRARSIRQYREQRPDYGWEITRALSRSLHVLTEHLDAYANEGYLQTATQWDNVRRLVHMLDYHPAPPASAQTPLVLIAKDGKRGVVHKGFQVKNQPPAGEAMAVFESGENLEIDAALNALKLKHWDRSVDTFRDLGTSSLSRLADRGAEAVQGVGPGYYQQLKLRAFPPSEYPEPDPETEHFPLTIGRLAQMEAADDEVRYWELITKARMLMQFDLDVETWEALLDWTLLDLVNADPSHLTEVSDQPKTRVAVLQESLRRLQIALDEMVFQPLTLAEMAGGGTESGEPVIIWRADKTQQVEAGQWALLVSTTLPFYAAAVKVDAFDEDTRRIDVIPVPHQKGWRDWVIAETRLHVRPRFRRAAWLNGTGVVRMDQPHGLGAGNVMAWENGGEWRFAEILEIDARNVRVAGASRPASGQNVFHAVPIARGSEGMRFPADYRLAVYKEAGDLKVVPEGELHVKGWDEGSFYEWPRTDIDEVFVVLDTATPVGAVQTVAPGTFTFDGKGDDFETGQWLIGEYAGEGGPVRYYPLQVLQKKQETDHFTLRATPAHHSGILFPSEATLLAVHGPFRDVIEPTGYGPNPDLLSGSMLQLDAASTGEFPDLLMKGRRVILKIDTEDPDKTVGHDAVLLKVDPVQYTLFIDPPVKPEQGLTVGRTRIHGNAVGASHGETKPEKVLGSGSATAIHQQFVLEAKEVTFVPDATHPFGVRAAIEVRVEGQTWEQQATLSGSRPEDPHYTVQLTEDGHLRIQFGDGLQGRRLPSGTNNVRLLYRQGTGSAGNQPAGSLIKPVKPHPAVKEVMQPFPASGGNERETIDSIRDNAPSSVLTLERAVSETDFSHLAMRHSSVWQARAWFHTAGYRRQESVEVVVVPADGIRSEKVERDIAGFLQSHALPGVHIRLGHFEPVLFSLTVTVRIKFDEYDRDRVLKDVQLALEQQLSLRQRRLGQPLYRSTLFKIVEGVQGVENSMCELGEPVYTTETSGSVRRLARSGDRSIRVIYPARNQVLHLETASPLLTLRAEEYSL